MELLEILDDYKENFCEKICVVETSLKEINSIKIYFSKTDLHHLLGLHKVTSGKNASKTIEEIERNKLTINKVRKHHNYNIIKPRIKNYGFIYEVFYGHEVDLCIAGKDIKPNSMNLNLIFYKKKNHEVIVLGLRKNSKNNIYYLTTLHKTYENKYDKTRKTKIKSIKWI